MRKIILIIALLAPSAAHASLANVYLTQSASGGDTGVDCSNAHAITFFNTAGNWGNGAAQIGAGTIVHLCGTINGAAGDTGLTFQGSGTSGNPITLKFETNAAMKAPYWGNGTTAAVFADSKNFITIDGGTNGLIQNTLEGEVGGTCPGGTCSFRGQSTLGVYLLNCSSATVQNLNVTDIYVRTQQSDEGSNSANPFNPTGIQIRNTSLSGATNITIKNNTIRDSQTGIFYMYGTNESGLVISGNKISRMNWGIGIGNGGGSVSLTGGAIFNNEIFDCFNWNDQPTPYSFHHNYMFFYTSAGQSLTGLAVYNNYMHGDFGSGTSMMQSANLSNGGQTISITYFNNIIALSATTGTTGGNAAISAQSNANSPTTINAYNNTMIGVATMYGFWWQGLTTTLDIRNNIMSNWGTLEYFNTSAPLPATQNRNDWDLKNGQTWFNNNSTLYGSLAAWTTATGRDPNSSSAAPNLNVSFVPNAGSPAIGLGQNLTSLCNGNLSALCSDKNGVARPSNGAWDAGALQSGGGGACSPTISSVTLNPTSVTGGTNSTGTVTISCAPSVDTAVSLLSSNTAVATVPTSVKVLANNTTANFTVTTVAVCTLTNVTITATLGGSATATLTVTPGSLVISSVTLNPTSVVGGNTSTGTVMLSCAPTSNTVVSLSSSNTAVATVPDTVTVLANQTTATFTVTTVGVCVSTNVTITATLNGSTTASLTVTVGGALCQGAVVGGNAKISGTAKVQ